MLKRLSWGGLITMCVVLVGAAVLPVQLHAQTGTNHAPLITSQPPATVSADALYQYTIAAEDRDNDTLTYRLTTAPEAMQLAKNILSWQPTTAGVYNVVLEVNDQRGAYDNQAWQITVAPGAVAALAVTPNNRPTVVNLGDNQQFTVSAADRNGNVITNAVITWSTDAKIGSINQSGLFLAAKGGTGFVAATSGDIKASIGVVVKDIRPTLVTNTNSRATNTNASGEAASTTKSTNTNKTNTNTPDVSDQTISGNTDTSTNTNSENNNQNSSCTNPARWIMFILLAIYAVILLVYYRYEKKHTSSAWWIFPFLLTVIGLIFFYKYVCSGTYLWWPWLLVGLGVILTVFYKGRRSTDHLDDSQTSLPF